MIGIEGIAPSLVSISFTLSVCLKMLSLSVVDGRNGRV